MPEHYCLEKQIVVFKPIRWDVDIELLELNWALIPNRTSIGNWPSSLSLTYELHGSDPSFTGVWPWPPELVIEVWLPRWGSPALNRPACYPRISIRWHRIELRRRQIEKGGGGRREEWGVTTSLIQASNLQQHASPSCASLPSPWPPTPHRSPPTRWGVRRRSVPTSSMRQDLLARAPWGAQGGATTVLYQSRRAPRVELHERERERERESDFRPIQPGLTSREGVRLYKTVSNSSNPNKRPVPGFGSCTVRGSPTQIFGKICSRTLLKGGFCHRPLKKIGLASTHSWNVTICSWTL